MNKRKTIWILFLLLAALTVFFLFLIKTLLGDLSVFLPYASDLSGFGGEKKYLILLQNNNELRPGGGFISAYGVLEAAGGKFSLDFKDSYSLLSDATNLPAAPEPFYVLFDDYKGWYFHDANFDADFSDAAEDVEALYWNQLGQKGSFDGIIGVNFEFLEDLVGIYDLELDGVGLSRENLFSILEYKVKNIDTHDVEELKNRKNVLGELAGQLIRKMAFSFSKYDNLFDAINTGLDQKKLILFFKNKKLQQAVGEEGWTGKFDPSDYKNFIYTSIANLGGRKADRYVRKNHEYFVSFDSWQRGKVRYTLTFEHFGGYNLNSDVYRAYVRTFVPRGVTENGYFENYIEVKPGEKKEIIIEYSLEFGQSDFDLDIIKQPGTKDFWELILQLPADNSFRADGFEVKDNVGFWSGYLFEDKHFDFEYIEDIVPPLIVWQKFLKPNLVEINFSEPLDERTFLNPDNYEITDMNYVDRETEIVDVKKVYFKDGNVYLETEGVGDVEGERYNLVLKNLEDKSDNKTIPPVLEVTLVKR